ncbi:protein ZINC INDUCED FACILITATOR 1 isoform X4 [Cryptomeria japonica]|uniref:protein ZINC INDUCED FACILITATOR 1 isoform X4 n=1 Tax=Cryptomeria japonica TaxID=3369 RepID=UPI0025ACEC23|nr:protein ZINC INDUCED FACILITATOR 1 isoform X4 [Cryptomeria japonica]
MANTSNNTEHEPLLKRANAVYFEGCEACQLERRKEQQRSYPLREFFFVGMVVLVNALPISSLFPFLYFMVRDFHVTNRSEDIATYAGILGSSFMVGRFLFSVIWGVAADRYGRKPVIIIGAISIIVLNTLFGLSVNYWMAISTRFLLGTFNGLIGTIKAYATEVSREEHHAAGLSIVTTTWGIGLIIGPAIGGFLAQPTQKYPYIFSTDSFWERFPYFLPCVVISTFAIPVLVLSFLLPVMTITGTFLLLNNAAPQDQRAAANGLQMSGMSFFKAIGPAAAGVLFSWGQKRQNSDFLPGFHMVCFILNIIVIIFTIMTFDPILPRSTNKPLAKDGNDLGSEKQRQIEQEDVPAS